MMSSFSGKIKEFPQISVDRFDGRNLASTAYFLSHAHSDHMIGLSSPQFLDHLESNSGVYLYCSQITARFLQASIRHRPLSPYVFPLQHEESVKITVPNVAEEATHQLWVTLIPAAHCPGSVMFLFEGRGGTVLYTGDFRTSVGEVARIRPLHNADGTVKFIDSLLIDTTFCHKDIMHFPTREESAQAVGEAVEDWLARGNNFVIHLVCPAKYGYEFIYRSLHDRFGMKIHVSRWIYCMYDTVPEIQDVLTLDATVTWIHACTFRIKNGEEATERRQLPCRFVPFGVNNTPNIRVIKPSALFYTFYQSAKEIMQINNDGTFCRVLLSTHASCSEVLDMVSYLRPRKVFPNVIPSNSTKEQVLKLLHEALNRSGDHYSIEYGGSQRTSLGSFKRQLNSSDSTCSGNTSSSILDVGLLDVYFSSPNKRRRHSDSNMTLILPTPRGNIKGSLSLEGETRHEESQPCTSVSVEKSTTFSISDSVQGEDEFEWRDPYTPSPTKSQPFFQNSPETYMLEATRQNASAKDNLSVELPVLADAETSMSRTSINVNGTKDFLSHRKSTNDMELEETTSSKCDLKAQESHDSVELSSAFSEDGDRDSIFDPFDSRPSSCAPLSDESPIKQSRKLWYKHKYFSTPVHDEVEKVLKFDVKSCIGPRSSSLPLPEHCRDDLLSPEFSTSVDGDRNLPLITVSSPSDQLSESQVSDETNVTVVLSSGDPSDSDLPFSDELPVDNSTNAENNNRTNNNNNTHSVRPSVICSPSKPDADEVEKWDASESRHDAAAESMKKSAKGVETADSGWIDCSKLKRRKTYSVETPRTKVQIGHVQKTYRVNISESSAFVVRNNEEPDMSPEFVDLVSDGDCSPEFLERSLSQTQQEASSILPSSSRSSCLKTVRRTHDHVEVVSLDHHPL